MIITGAVVGVVTNNLRRPDWTRENTGSQVHVGDNANIGWGLKKCHFVSAEGGEKS